MNGIWAVKDKQDNGTVKFANPAATVSSSDFATCLSDAQKNAIVDSFTQSSEIGSVADISLLLPTRQNVETISAYMQGKIKDAFEDYGIKDDPPVTFTMDDGGNIHASGNRDDLSKIDSIFQNDPKLGRDMRNFMAMASEMPRFERAMEYNEKYQQAHSMAEIDALNREYSDLFDGADHSSVSFQYGSGGLDVNATYNA